MNEIIPIDTSENWLDTTITSSCADSVKDEPLRISVIFKSKLWIIATNAYEPLFNCWFNEVSFVVVEFDERELEDSSLNNVW